MRRSIPTYSPGCKVSKKGFILLLTRKWQKSPERGAFAPAKKPLTFALCRTINIMSNCEKSRLKACTRSPPLLYSVFFCKPAKTSEARRLPGKQTKVSALTMLRCWRRSSKCGFLFLHKRKRFRCAPCRALYANFAESCSSLFPAVFFTYIMVERHTYGG